MNGRGRGWAGRAEVGPGVGASGERGGGHMLQENQPQGLVTSLQQERRYAAEFGPDKQHRNDNAHVSMRAQKGEVVCMQACQKHTTLPFPSPPPTPPPLCCTNGDCRCYAQNRCEFCKESSLKGILGALQVNELV